MVVVVVQVERKAFSESAAKAEADLLKAREEIKTLQKEVKQLLYVFIVEARGERDGGEGVPDVTTYREEAQRCSKQSNLPSIRLSLLNPSRLDRLLPRRDGSIQFHLLEAGRRAG